MDDAVGGYVAGVGLDLLAAWLLVWATVALRGLPWRLSLASALFGGLHLFGGWQREPQELVFSATVLLCVLACGAHARALAVARARQQILRRSVSAAHYWQEQLAGLVRQLAFEAVTLLALLALLALEGLLVRMALGR